MRVLVTGHRGYVGTALVPLLISQGHETEGMDADFFAGCSFGEPPLDIPHKKMDIRDARLSDLRGFEAVIHLAGLSNDPLGDLDPELTWEINFKSSVRLAQMAREAGVRRFVFSSSCSVYGAKDGEFVKETDTLEPVTPYARSKVLAEKEIKRLEGPDFCPVFLRNATAYGFSPRIRFDLALNNLMAWAFSTKKVYLKSKGNAWRPFVHVEDIARAFAAVLSVPLESVRGQAFNVGETRENYQILAAARLVRDTAPGSEIIFADGALEDIRCYRVNCDKIFAALPRFKTEWTLAKGARQLLDAYRKNTLSPDDFEGPRYKRIDHIHMLIREGVLDKRLRFKQRESKTLGP
ncbi:NAD-dependent epimerase/dehydratase [Candidatus Desulfarcum epimagneticum]|uniref:NAD-dependent epimerase/dehydratase n=1 Tax=uncultured Desulfobacteraceae bacterium TaxID=218296 RepID=A0A484HI88_9BACT|nr:NAD-dependent epimerase/dehydratase [uncultured Desulfobacteraceae bacterium]